MNNSTENQCIIQSFSHNEFYEWAMAFQYLRSTNGLFRRLINTISTIRNSSYVDSEGFMMLLKLNQQRKCLQFHRVQAKGILLKASQAIEEALDEGHIIAFDLSKCTTDEHFFRWLNQILQMLPTSLECLDALDPIRPASMTSLDELVEMNDGRLVLIQLSDTTFTGSESAEKQLSVAQLAARGYGLSTPFMSSSQTKQ